MQSVESLSLKCKSVVTEWGDGSWISFPRSVSLDYYERELFKCAL